MSKFISIVTPEPIDIEALRDRVGVWARRDDGLWVLSIPVPDSVRSVAVVDHDS